MKTATTINEMYECIFFIIFITFKIKLTTFDNVNEFIYLCDYTL